MESLEKSLKVTKLICDMIGACGVPVVGVLGGICEIGLTYIEEENKEKILQKNFKEIKQTLKSVQKDIDSLKDMTEKTLKIVTDMHYKGDIRTVESYCKTIMDRESIEDSIEEMDGQYRTEVRTCANKAFEISHLKSCFEILANSDQGNGRYNKNKTNYTFM